MATRADLQSALETLNEAIAALTGVLQSANYDDEVAAIADAVKKVNEASSTISSL